MYVCVWYWRFFLLSDAQEKVKPNEVRHFVSGFLKVMLMFGVLSKSVRIRYSIYEVYGCGANFARVNWEPLADATGLGKLLDRFLAKFSQLQCHLPKATGNRSLIMHTMS